MIIVAIIKNIKASDFNCLPWKNTFKTAAAAAILLLSVSETICLLKKGLIMSTEMLLLVRINPLRHLVAFLDLELVSFNVCGFLIVWALSLGGAL